MATRYSQLNIDIDTLKQKTGVTDTQLDQTIEQEQLMSLASLLGSYMISLLEAQDLILPLLK